ncbi:MAG TPA: PAS domain-containing protein [Lacibacter sp.]|nr:PAS domain-containing protein [Lacibacter sp.]
MNHSSHKKLLTETSPVTFTAVNELLERYDFLSKATSDTIWDWDITNDTIVYNGGIEKMFGYAATEVQEIRTWWISNIHTQDIDHVHQMLQTAFKRQNQNVELMYRYKCADGTYKYIFDRAFILYNNEGIPVRMIGSMQDETIRYEEGNRITKAIIHAQERERQQLGMELHDNVNQILSAASLQLGFLASKKSINEPALQTVCTVKKYITEAIDEIRRLSHQLAPASDDDVSLCELIRNLVNSVNVNEQYKVSYKSDFPSSEFLLQEIRVGLYRILQEQLNNIVKHAKATAVAIEISHDENCVSLKIADDGVGFDVTTTSSGIGFENIKRRVKYLNGTFHIESQPQKGCVVKVTVPVAENLYEFV